VGNRLPLEETLDGETFVVLDGPRQAWDELAALSKPARELADRLLRALPVITIAANDAPAWVREACDLSGDAAGWIAAIERAPYACLAGTLLVREPPATTEAGLAAESAVYSMLQASPEHQTWLRTRAGCSSPENVRAAAPGSGETASKARVRVERAGHVVTVSLARAERHNALDPAMRDALVGALEPLRHEPATQVVLRGDGPSFCSGGDLDTFGTAPPPAEAHSVRLVRSPAHACASLGPQLTARIHGHCLGAGIELAAFARRVVCTDDAVIGLPEIDLGLIPGAGGTVSIPRRAGRHRFLELMISRRSIDAETAKRWGLVDEVVAA
jgi:hypothetical protein